MTVHVTATMHYVEIDFHVLNELHQIG